MIEPRYFWLNIMFLAIGTIGIRFSFIAMSSRVQISSRWREIFSYIPVAILPAFVAPAVFFHEGHVDSLLGKERFVVLTAASVICYLTRSTTITIGFGLFALWLFN